MDRLLAHLVACCVQGQMVHNRPDKLVDSFLEIPTLPVLLRRRGNSTGAIEKKQTVFAKNCEAPIDTVCFTRIPESYSTTGYLGTCRILDAADVTTKCQTKKG